MPSKKILELLQETLFQNPEVEFSSQTLTAQAMNVCENVTPQKVCDAMRELVRKGEAIKVSHGRYRAKEESSYPFHIVGFEPFQ